MKAEVLDEMRSFLVAEEVIPNHIQILNKISESKQKSILKSIPQSVYVEDDDIEIDRYHEVHFYLSNGKFIQNAVNQRYFTKTVQGFFEKEGETIESAIMRLNVQNVLDSIILYNSSYKEVKGEVIVNTKNVCIINWDKVVYLN
jgi:hypothetical protein